LQIADHLLCIISYLPLLATFGYTSKDVNVKIEAKEFASEGEVRRVVGPMSYDTHYKLQCNAIQI
jgi:hypothetical protein